MTPISPRSVASASRLAFRSRSSCSARRCALFSAACGSTENHTQRAVYRIKSFCRQFMLSVIPEFLMDWMCCRTCALCIMSCSCRTSRSRCTRLTSVIPKYLSAKQTDPIVLASSFLANAVGSQQSAAWLHGLCRLPRSRTHSKYLDRFDASKSNCFIDRLEETAASRGYCRNQVRSRQVAQGVDTQSSTTPAENCHIKSNQHFNQRACGCRRTLLGEAAGGETRPLPRARVYGAGRHAAPAPHSVFCCRTQLRRLPVR